MLKSSKKILAWFLVVLMIVSVVPLTSFAWDYTLYFVKKQGSGWNGYTNSYSALLHDGNHDYIKFVLKEVSQDGVINVKRGSNFNITLSCGSWTVNEATNGNPPDANLNWHMGDGTTTNYCISSKKSGEIGYWTAYRANDPSHNAIQSGVSGTIANKGGQDEYRGRPENGGSREATGIWEFTTSSFPELNTPGTYQIYLNPTLALSQWKTSTWWAIWAWGNPEFDSNRVIPVTVRVVEDYKFVNNNGSSKTVSAVDYAEAVQSAPANTSKMIVNNNNGSHTETTYKWPSAMGTAGSGSVPVSYYTTVSSNEEKRGGTNDVAIVSDGGIRNTSFGLIQFDLNQIPELFDTVNLNLNYSNLNRAQRLCVIPVPDNKGIASPTDTSIVGDVYKSGYSQNTETSYKDVLEYFGVNHSDAIILKDFSGAMSTRTESFGITNKIRAAKEDGQDKLTLLFVIQGSGTGGEGNWSDIHIYTNNSYLSWVYLPSRTVNEIASEKTSSCLYGAETVIEAATCSESGTKQRTCEVCGYVNTITVPATGVHKEVSIPQIDATCTSAGSTAGVKCADCGTILIAPTEIGKLSHRLTRTYAKPETCNTAGNIDYWTCKECKQIFTDGAGTITAEASDVIIPATGNHTGGKATCESGPICSVCKTEYGPALGHDIATGEAQTPNCINPGWEEYEYCKRTGCNYSTKVVIPKTGIHTGGTATCSSRAICSVCDRAYGTYDPNNHSFVNYVPAGDATCKTDGTLIAHCEYGCSKTDSIPDVDSHLSVAHTEKVIKGYDATCTAAGLTDGKECSVCGIMLEAQEIIPLKDHVDNDNDNLCDVCHGTMCAHSSTTIVGYEAETCKEEGFTGNVVCNDCNRIVEAGTVITKLEHTIETLPAVTVTCTTDGKTEGSKCSVCQTILVPQETITATGHTEVTTKENVVDATCHNKGTYTEVVTCSVCNTEISRTDKEEPALEHVASDAVQENIAGATCSVAGSYDNVVRCKLCGDILSSEHITGEFLPHTPSEVAIEVIETASCSEEGSHYEVVTCSICSAEISRVEVTDNKLPHTDEDHDKICDICNAQTCIHPDDLGAWTIINPDADCTQGYIEKATCTICGESEERGTGIYGAHKFTTGSDTKVYFESTCESTGLRCHYCELCGTLNIETNTIVIPKKPHNFGTDTVVSEATCINSEVLSSTCLDCGLVVIKAGKAPKGHHIVWVETKAATCEEEGIASLTCDRCNEILSQKAIEKLEHTLVLIEAVPSTCTQEGLTKGYSCSVCNSIVIEPKAVSMASHLDTDSDGVCNICSQEIENAHIDHNCLCHKQGLFYTLIYKIAKIVWKIFGTNKVCACGEVHYE